MSQKPEHSKFWLDPPPGRPEKKPLTKTDALYFGMEAVLVLLGISFFPSPQSGIALMAILLEIGRRVTKDLN